MVALLVVFTIVACLIADTIVMSVRNRQTVSVMNPIINQSRELHPDLIFAQDGGTPIEDDSEKLD